MPLYSNYSLVIVMENTCCNDTCKCDSTNIPENRMCQLTQPAHEFDLEKVKKLTSNSKYICKCCGRTANSEDNLCSPTLLR